MNSKTSLALLGAVLALGLAGCNKTPTTTDPAGSAITGTGSTSMSSPATPMASAPDSGASAAMPDSAASDSMMSPASAASAG